jgi:membrane dipeptidase
MIVDISHVSEEVMRDVLKTSLAPVMFSHSGAYSVHAHVRNVKDDVLQMLKINGGVVMVNFYSNFITNKPNEATIDHAIRHLNHIRNKIGADHVGIGSDFDGVEAMPKGLDDVSKFPQLFDRLARAPYFWSAEELRKLAGLNTIRIFKQAEFVRDSLRYEPVIEDLIPSDDITSANVNAAQCRTDLSEYTKTRRGNAMKFSAAEGM